MQKIQIMITKSNSSSIEGWAGVLLKDEGLQEKREFSPSEFMSEYETLKERFNKTHSTEDFKNLTCLYERYDISRADQLKYARIHSMLTNQKYADGMILGSVPAKDIEGLLQEGDFAGALTKIRAGLNEDSLQQLVDFPEDKRYFEGYSQTQWLPELIKSETHKSSDYLLQSFGMYKEGDQYVVRVNKEEFQNDMSNPLVLNNFNKDLKDIEKNWFSLDLDLPGGEGLESNITPNKRKEELINQTAINYEVLANEDENVDRQRQLRL